MDSSSQISEPDANECRETSTTPQEALAVVVPQALKERPQWVCWKYVQRGEKATKVPVSARTRKEASSTDAGTWSTFEEALACWKENPRMAGVGYVFSADDPFCGIDLDGCIGDDGIMVPAAREIVDRLDSYTEISPSKKGVKIIVRGAKPAFAKCKSRKFEGFKETEVYDKERFFTVTGDHWFPSPLLVEERQAQLDELCQRLWPQEVKTAPEYVDESGGDEVGILSQPGFPGDDDQLLLAASRSKSGEKFRRLWEGETNAYGKDDSAADMALCCMLAFWTAKDASRMDRLFRRSKLYRDKWERTDYRESTLQRAIEKCRDVYVHRAKSSEAPPDRIKGEWPVPLGQLDPITGMIVLSPKRTLPTAEAFVKSFYSRDNKRTVLSYASLLMAWQNNRYTELEDQHVKQQLLPWLHEAVRFAWNKDKKCLEPVRFDANPSTVTTALESVRTLVHVPANITPPAWLDGRTEPPAREILCCKTQNLHIPKETLLEPTPKLFNINAIEFDYDPNAPKPERWFKFLHETLGADAESVQLLQEWFGYCLSADTSQQKMLLLVGPKRCGKGTIARVLGQLVGGGNVCGPTISSLAGPFGLQALIGKTLGIVSDARFSGNTLPAVIERLLCISGEDTLTIDRKHLPSVTLKLPTRLMFLTNELPRLADSSGALAGRFLIVQFTQSFYGKEDPTLTQQLLKELPGILLWSLDGWKRLNERGRFVQPREAEETLEQLSDLASPVSAFVRECCIVGSGHKVLVDDLYRAWSAWCYREGWTNVSTKPMFGRELFAAFASVRKRRNRDYGLFYEGVALTDAESIAVHSRSIASPQQEAS